MTDGVTKMAGDNVVPRRHRRPTATKRATQCHKCHACHANEGGCHQVPHLPRKTKIDVAKCHACRPKYRGVTGDQRRPSAPHSAISATLATENQGECEMVLLLPRETKVDVTLCHACHAKCVRKLCVKDGM